MKSIYKSIGELVERIDQRNTDGTVTNLVGVSIDKKFINSVANAKLYGSKPRLLTEVQSPARCRKLNTKRNGKITKWSCRFLFALMCRIFHIYVV